MAFRKGVSIRETELGIFLFQIFHQLDVQRVLKQGPWSFDNHILILGVMQEGETLEQVPLFTVPYWVQVHNVPVGFMSETVGNHLGNFIGELLEYDAKIPPTFERVICESECLLMSGSHRKG